LEPYQEFFLIASQKYSSPMISKPVKPWLLVLTKGIFWRLKGPNHLCESVNAKTEKDCLALLDRHEIPDIEFLKQGGERT